jgi:hypothetical protein
VGEKLNMAGLPNPIQVLNAIAQTSSNKNSPKIFEAVFCSLHALPLWQVSSASSPMSSRIEEHLFQAAGIHMTRLEREFFSRFPPPFSQNASRRATKPPPQSSGTPENNPKRIRWLCSNIVSSYSHLCVKLSLLRRQGTLMTYKRQFGYNNGKDCQEVDDKVREVVVRIMGAEEEQHYWHAEEKLFGWSVLGAIVDLFPHVQVIESSAIEFEGHATNVVEHEIRAEHVGDVCQRPRGLLRDTWDHIVKDLKARYQDNVDGPRS